MKTRLILKTTPLLFLLFFLVKTSITNAQQNLSKSGLAVSGYDLVSYHSAKPVKGTAEHKVTHRDAVYYFKDQANKEAFKKDPEKYLPQYGGWCAYAMGANGKKVSINPESFTVEEGKLYLFYKTAFTDTRKKWIGKTAKLKEKANRNWSDILQKY